MACVFRLFKIGVEEVQLFYGKPVASLQAGGIQWNLGWIPTGFSVKYQQERFQALPRPAQTAFYLLMPLPLIAIGVALLGGEGAWHHLWTGFRQYLEGALRPQQVAWPLVDKLRQLHAASTPRFIGVVSSKRAVLQILPLGVTATTEALWALFKKEPPAAHYEPAWLHAPMVYGSFLNILCLIIWTVLLLTYALKTGL